MAYLVQYSDEALKVLAKLENASARRIVTKIDELAEMPHNTVGIKALKGTLKGRYRLRVGDYRVIYSVKDEVLLILILDIGHRKDIYR